MVESDVRLSVLFCSWHPEREPELWNCSPRAVNTYSRNRKLKKAKNPSPNNAQATKNRSPHVPVEQLKILVKIRPPRRAIDSLPEVMMMTRTMRMWAANTHRKMSHWNEQDQKRRNAVLRLEKPKKLFWMQKVSVRLVNVLTSQLQVQRIPKKWKTKEMKLVMEKYVQKTGQCQFNAKFLRKIKIQVALNKHRKTKCCPYCPFTEPENASMVQKLTRHVDKFHSKQLRDLNLQRINKEIEDLEEGRETVQTETELKKTEEREGQSHSLDCLWRSLYLQHRCFQEVQRDAKLREQIDCCQGSNCSWTSICLWLCPMSMLSRFLPEKKMYRHKTDCPASGKIALSMTGKNDKAATFALMIEVKATKDTPFEQYVFTRMRHDEYGNIARRDPLIQYLGQWYFNKRKADEGYLQINDRMRTMASLYTNSIAHTWLKSLISKCGQEWKKLLWHSKSPTGLKWDQYWKQLLRSYATRLGCGKRSQYRKRQESSRKF